MALLTKSNYLLGVQCPRLLWVSKNDKKRLPKPDELAEQKFKVGTMIGELATKVFPNGQSIPTEDFEETIKQTKLLILENKSLKAQ